MVIAILFFGAYRSGRSLASQRTLRKCPAPNRNRRRGPEGSLHHWGRLGAQRPLRQPTPGGWPGSNGDSKDARR
eukprot:10598889-Heterocapsa_arctica.AAC.1